MTRLAVMTAAAVLSAFAAAQQSAALPQTTFRSGIELVAIDVSVTRNGQPVPNLTARDFVLTDNGAAQEVESVMLDRLPLSVTMVLDTSQSVAGDRLAHLVAAGNELMAALRPEDRAALITFSHKVDLRVPMTTDRFSIQRALTAMSGIGATALRDAVQLALEISPRDQTRPLLLLFTDGHDTASWLTEDAVLDSARRTGVVTQVVRVESDPFLDQLVKASGGRLWSATSDRQLRELFTHALEEMRARYLLTFTPRGVKGPGWHELKVKLKNGRADVTARPGYFVP
jgi:uncharacterized protein YegL